jgi:anthranilate phosphoribosyltransferase
LVDAGFAFLFAQLHHPALATFAPIRRALRLRTVFNLLGPIANPARVRKQIVGVALADHAAAIAGALSQSHRQHALVVRGLDGMDEISPFAPTVIIEIRDGDAREYELDPRSIVRSPNASVSDAHVDGGVDAAAERFMRVLDGTDRGAAADAVALNAGAGLYLAGRAQDIAAGYHLAVSLLDGGEPARYLESLVEPQEKVQ